MKISHVGLYVNDLYPMQLYYTKILGFKLKYSYVSGNTPGLKTIFLKRANIGLELLHHPEKKSVPGTGNKNFHLALEVGDVDREARRLQGLGVQICRGPRTTGDGCLELEIMDPEGNVIEISRRVAPLPRYTIKAVLFDLDGTIIDSEENYYEADRLLLARYGIDFTREMKNHYIGIGNQALVNDFKRKHKINATTDEMLALKNQFYLELARNNTTVFKNMLRFIQILHKRRMPLALASGSSPEILSEITSALGLSRYFQVMVSAEEVGKSKPHPDLFLETAKRLGVEPQHCLVVEDAQYGVEAAKRAFMKCLAVPSLAEEPLQDAFLTADLLFSKGMKEFHYKRACNWIERQAR